MKKFKINTIAIIAVYAMLAVVFLSGCNNSAPKQIVYESDGLILTLLNFFILFYFLLLIKKQLNNKP